MAAPKGNNYRATGINLTPLERFMAKCRFDAGTGCVIWTGAKTSGRGHSAPYGSFWFENRRWFAHRWAAQHIHGHAIDGLQVEHYCPNRSHPNTLCVEHVHPLPSLFNRELQTLRGQTPSQDVAIEAELKKNFSLASQLGATGTPLFVVGDRVLSGAVGYDALKKAVEAAQKKA